MPHSQLAYWTRGLRLCGLVVIALLAATVFAQGQENFGIGNLVFVDHNGNSRYDEGIDQGIEGVQVELYLATDDPAEADPIRQMPTQSGGFYFFNGLKTGDYVVYIPPSQFAPGAPLAKMLSVPGVSLDSSDDDVGEDGYDDTDPHLYGITSRPVSLGAGAQPTNYNGETGFAHTMDDDNDADSDLTVDLGFYRPVSLGNLVYGDMNGDGVAQGTEGIPGVTVRLFHSVDTPGVDLPITDVTTDAAGRFLFENLVSGYYKLFIPPTQFAEGGVLEGAMSIPGIAELRTDDDVGEDGLDSADPATTGITSVIVELVPGMAPTGGSGETGQGAAEDDSSDENVDLTVDFGFDLPAAKVGVGNLVFFDANNNHVAEPNEGVDGVKVQLFAEGATVPLAERTTANGGFYLFSNLEPGNYFLHIPSSEFAVGRPLFSAVSVIGSVQTGDDNVAEDGLDGGVPSDSGVSTAVFTLALGGAPTFATGETGLGSEVDDYQDDNVDLTRDFGFRISTLHPVGVGNLVFVDANYDGLYTAGEGRNGVTVQLYREGDVAGVTPPLSVTTTQDEGIYGFNNLVPGRYFVHIPASQFAISAPLDQMLSIAGAGEDNGIDDGIDENGIDSENPTLTGISSIVFELTNNGEPTDQTTETGRAALSDNSDDNNTDLTIDLGFVRTCPALNITPSSLTAAVIQESYSVTFTATGGTAPYVWGAALALPAGLTLNSSTGELSGTPTVEGMHEIRVYAQDAIGCRTTVSRSLSVGAAVLTAGVGNLLFIDANGDGIHQPGEGVGSVTVQLFSEGDDPQSDSAIRSTQTAPNGTYSFVGLPEGRYFIHVPASEFAVAAPLFNQISVPGVSLDNGVDDGVTGNDNGVDAENPTLTGISSVVFELIPGSEPVDSPGTETGFLAAADNTNPGDAHFDSTIDLAFVAAPGVSVGVGNLVFNDLNTNGRYDTGEGVNGVLVKLYAENSNPALDPELASRITTGGGRYLFTGLPEGRYFLHIPASEFASGKALAGRISMMGNQSDDGVDDDEAGENGVDSGNPSVSGIFSVVFELTLGGEPTASGTELGTDTELNDPFDANVDLTMDFGFVLSCPAMAISPGVLPDAPVGLNYNQAFQVSAGTAPFVWSVVSGELPEGIVFDESTVSLSGQATLPGTYFFSLRVRDALGCQAQRAFELVVEEPVATLGLGNLVFIDANQNGRFDNGEGVNGITLELFAAGDDPQNDDPIDTQVTAAGGFYQFTGLTVGDYFVHIPFNQFTVGAPLNGMLSLAGWGADNGLDDDMDENGIDEAQPAVNGISSTVVHLAPGTEPVGLPGTETGAGASLDDTEDTHFDATVDFGFTGAASAVLGVGNLIFTDTNRNGEFESGEGVADVVVQLFRAGEDAQNDTPLQSQTTSSLGHYGFGGLLPGRYFVHVPASQFVAAAPLAGQRSVAGHGLDDGHDDDVDENGVDAETPAATGVSSVVFSLGVGTEPVDAGSETGEAFGSDSPFDSNVDLTIDLGFVSPPIIIAPIALASGHAMEEYAQQLSAVGGQAPYSYLVSVGSLPDGLILNSSGALTGTPTTAGTSNFTIEVKDAHGAKDVRLYTLVIDPARRVGVGNLVFFDFNANGHAEAREGVSGVTVQLYRATDIPGSVLPLASRVTDGAGLYRFDDLIPGNYILHIPAAMFQAGAPLANMISMSGVGIGDDDQGEDGQDAVSPALTGVSTAAVALSFGNAPTFETLETGIGSGADDAMDAAVDLTIDFGFVDSHPMPATYADWQALRNLGGEGAPTANPDGDLENNLIEYALLGNPASGIQQNASLKLVEQESDGSFDLTFVRRRGSQADLSYAVQVVAGLDQLPSGWVPTSITPTVTNNGDGTETVTYADLDSDPAFLTGERGFVRLRIALDSNGDSVPEAEGQTQIYGWSRSALSSRNQTYGVTFLAAEILSGRVNAVNGATVDLSTASGGQNLIGLFQASYQYYLEVVSGTHEGQRWEIDEAQTSGAILTLLPAHAHSTSAVIPADLVSASVVIRPHWRVRDLMPVADFHAANGAGSADNLYYFDSATNSFLTLWLFAGQGNPRWVTLGDSNFVDAGNRVIAPADGLFTRPRVSGLTSVQKGKVRTWKFACPLRSGSNFIGNPWPVDQSPALRSLTIANGFTGSTGFRNADRIFVWEGDASANSNYVNYFLLKFGNMERWVRENDVNLTDQSAAPLFRAGGAVFFISVNGHPNWVISPPFAP